MINVQPDTAARTLDGVCSTNYTRVELSSCRNCAISRSSTGIEDLPPDPVFRGRMDDMYKAHQDCGLECLGSGLLFPRVSSAQAAEFAVPATLTGFCPKMNQFSPSRR